MGNNNYNELRNYIIKVVNNSFDIINKLNDAKLVIMVIGDGKKDVTCLVFAKSYHTKVYDIIGAELVKTFKSNFGLDIKLFPYMTGYAQNCDYMESKYTRDLVNNGDYIISIHNSTKSYESPIDPNHTLLYFEPKSLLSNITINLFPRNMETPFFKSMYPGYNPKSNECRMLYLDIMKIKRSNGTYPGSYLGMEGWKRYIEDYMEVCDGLKPDHDFHYSIICDKVL